MGSLGRYVSNASCSASRVPQAKNVAAGSQQTTQPQATEEPGLWEKITSAVKGALPATKTDVQSSVQEQAAEADKNKANDAVYSGYNDAANGHNPAYPNDPNYMKGYAASIQEQAERHKEAMGETSSTDRGKTTPYVATIAPRVGSSQPVHDENRV